MAIKVSSEHGSGMFGVMGGPVDGDQAISNRAKAAQEVAARAAQLSEPRQHLVRRLIASVAKSVPLALMAYAMAEAGSRK